MSKCHWCAGPINERGKRYCRQDHKDRALAFVHWPNQPPAELVQRDDVQHAALEGEKE